MENVNEKIKEALIKRATGYEYEEKEIIAGKDGKPEKVKIIKKHMPPDVSAIERVQYLFKSGIWNNQPENKSTKT